MARLSLLISVSGAKTLSPLKIPFHVCRCQSRRLAAESSGNTQLDKGGMDFRLRHQSLLRPASIPDLMYAMLLFLSAIHTSGSVRVLYIISMFSFFSFTTRGTAMGRVTECFPFFSVYHFLISTLSRLEAKCKALGLFEALVNPSRLSSSL